MTPNTHVEASDTDPAIGVRLLPAAAIRAPLLLLPVLAGIVIAEAVGLAAIAIYSVW